MIVAVITLKPEIMGVPLSEQMVTPAVSQAHSRWLKGFGAQLFAYASLLGIGVISGLRHRLVEDTVNDSMALATIAAFAVTLFGGIALSLAAIVVNGKMEWKTKLVAVLCSLVLFVSCFAFFFLIAMTLFVPYGMMMD